VAAFDFDGTLIQGDSFLLFLLRLCGPYRLSRAFTASTLALLLTGRFRLDRDASKADLVARLLTGYPAARLEAESEGFSRELVRRIRPALGARMDWHRAQGHRLLLVSASLETYLEPVGHSLGFDAVLATCLEVGPDKRLTGRLEGRNCRGQEKEIRLRAWLEANLSGAPTELWAYGDGSGDRELLAMADHPQLIRRSSHLLRRGLPGRL
jgi:HAD superfamily hydrolase (TIGR01490 family)